MSATVPVTVWHAAPLGGGESRITALADDRRTVHVAVLKDGARMASSEISFDLFEAYELAKACLAGHRRALTQPGLTRMLCAALVVSIAAAEDSGGLERSGV